MIDLHKLRHFVAVARAESFVRAAEELQLSQPALTRSIQSLERAWNVVLFDRGRAGVTLTSTGRQVLGRAQDLLYNARSLERSVDGISHGLSGEVRFSMGARLGLLVLPQLFTETSDLYPGIRLTSHLLPAENERRALLDDTLEFAVGVLGTVPTDQLTAELVTNARPDLLVRTGHPLLEQERIRYTDIAKYPLLSGSAFAEGMSLLAADDPRQVLHVAYQGDYYDAMAAVARSTDMVLIGLDGPDVQGLVPLQLSPREPALPVFPIGLYRHAGRTLSPAAQVIIDRISVILRATIVDRGGPSPTRGSRRPT